MLVIWDFNGTILCDKKVCLELLNESLAIEGIKNVTMRQYRRVFCFPVEEYYKKVGFDFQKTSFVTLANRFQEGYQRRFHENKVNPGILTILKKLKQAGHNQVILSATRQDLLEKQVNSLGIRDYFTDLVGISNIYGVSKLSEAVNYMNSKNIDTNDCVLIGDTIHDFEVGKALNIKTYIYTNGHMSKSRLRNYSTIDTFSELRKIFNV